MSPEGNTVHVFTVNGSDLIIHDRNCFALETHTGLGAFFLYRVMISGI